MSNLRGTLPIVRGGSGWNRGKGKAIRWLREQTTRETDELAQLIQRTIEDWIEYGEKPKATAS